MSEEHDPELYGEAVAHRYDALYGDEPETLPAVERLWELSQDGPAYELGIGTGRLALPLVERGLEVYGTESSEMMISKLRAKPMGEKIRVTVGDFSKVAPAGGPFSLAFLVFNTIFALADTSAQVACFDLVSQQLSTGGRFVVEAFVVDPQDFRHGRAIEVRRMSAQRVELQLTEYDAVQQKLHRVFLNVVGGEINLHDANDTYATPRELDLMARMAGLDLDQRWSDWTGTPFASDSKRHISVYRKR